MVRRKSDPKVYEEIARAHLAALDRVAEHGSAARLKKLYEGALAEMERRSRGLFSRPEWRDSFTAHQRRLVIQQLREGVRALTVRMGEELQQHAREAGAEGASTTVRNIRRLEEHYAASTPVLPVEEAARFVGAGPRGPVRTLLRSAARHGLIPGRIQTSMARYGARLVAGFEGDLARTLMTGGTLGDAIDRIQDRGDLEWYAAERIARTESAYAFNASQAETIEAASGELEGLHMRWSEHVSDVTGARLDDRVAADSLAMHGQVAPPGGSFVMPDDERVDSVRWGLRFEFPPNRPNDRAVLMPWRPHWGVPGWKWEAGRRVEL